MFERNDIHKHQDIHKRLIITGPGCSGKNYLLKSFRDFGIERINVSLTTRPKRDNEIEGLDYHFINDSVFDQSNMFEYTNFNNYRYGTICQSWECNHIFILTPNSITNDIFQDSNNFVLYLNVSKNVRKQRLVERCDNNDSVDRRLQGDDVLFDNFVNFHMEIIDEQFNADQLVQYLIDKHLKINIGIDGYYGNNPEMNQVNFDILVDECYRIISETVDPKLVILHSTNQMWANYVPIYLFDRYKDKFLGLRVYKVDPLTSNGKILHKSEFQTTQRLKIPQGAIFGILKRLEEENNVKVYQKESFVIVRNILFNQSDLLIKVQFNNQPRLYSDNKPTIIVAWDKIIN